MTTRLSKILRLLSSVVVLLTLASAAIAQPATGTVKRLVLNCLDTHAGGL
jgi:hypothetical protein